MSNLGSHLAKVLELRKYAPRSGGGDPSEFLDETYAANTRGMGLLYGENCMILTSTVFGRTDRQTDGRAIAYSALSICCRALIKHAASSPRGPAGLPASHKTSSSLSFVSLAHLVLVTVVISWVLVIIVYRYLPKFIHLYSPNVRSKKQKPDRQWRSSSFQESKKVRVSRDLWPWLWPWAHPGCMLTWSPSCASLVAIRPFVCEKKRFVLKFTDGQKDRRRTPRHCISSFLGGDWKCGSGKIGTVENAGMEKAGVEASARFCRGGKRRSGKIGTILQRWKMREWKNRHDFAGVENAGVETSEKINTDAECYAGVCREKNG